MLKYIVLLAFVLAVSCELRIHLAPKRNAHERMLFEKHIAKVVGHMTQVTDFHQKYYIPVKFGDKTFKANLAASLFDQFTWLPYQGDKNCQNTNDGDKQASDCNSKGYKCASPCLGGSGEFKDPVDNKKTYKFKSLVTNKFPVEVTKMDKGFDTLTFRETEVKNVPVGLVKEMKNIKSLKFQEGVLGLSYVDKTAKVINANLLTAMKEAKLISKEEFTYYISETENFLTFGIQNDYLSKFDFFNYTFTNENLCSKCTKDASQFDNKWALDITSWNLEQDLRAEKDQKALADVLSADGKTLTTMGMYSTKTSKIVFDTTVHGLSFSTDRYKFIRDKIFEPFPSVSNCKDLPEKVEQGGLQTHFQCDCGEKLENLPTFKFELKGQLKPKSTDSDQIWKLAPKEYAILNDKKCEVFIYTREDYKAPAATLQVDYLKADPKAADPKAADPKAADPKAADPKAAEAAGGKDGKTIADLKEWDDHIFVGRLFLRAFFTVFSQESKTIALSDSWYSPDPILLTDITMIIVLVLGILSIIIIFALINLVLKPLPQPKKVQRPVQVQQVQYVQSPAVSYQVIHQQQSPVYISQQHPQQMIGTQQYVQMK